jgi:exodeoxyribonuclease-3
MPAEDFKPAQDQTQTLDLSQDQRQNQSQPQTEGQPATDSSSGVTSAYEGYDGDKSEARHLQRQRHQRTRLEVLLRWLAEAKPDVVCLQELKAPDEKFPRREIERAGLRCYLARPEKPGTAWRSWPAIRNRAKPDAGCPATPTTATAAISKRRSTVSSWAVFIFPMEIPRQARSSTTSCAGSNACTPMRPNCWNWVPVALVGDFNVMPTELDVYKPERWLDDALFRRRSELHTPTSWPRAGRTRSGTCIPMSASIHSGSISGTPLPADAGLRIDHFLLSPDLAKRLKWAEVDKHVRGWEKTSDHAPVWIEIG